MEDSKNDPENSGSSNLTPAPESLPEAVFKATCSIGMAILTAICSLFLSVPVVSMFVFQGHQSAWGLELVFCFIAPIPGFIGYFVAFYSQDSKKDYGKRNIISAVFGVLAACAVVLLIYGVLVGKESFNYAHNQRNSKKNAKFWKAYFENYSTYPDKELKAKLKTFGTEQDGLWVSLPSSRSDRIDELVKILVEQKDFSLLSILSKKVAFSHKSVELIVDAAFKTLGLGHQEALSIPQSVSIEKTETLKNSLKNQKLLSVSQPSSSKLKTARYLSPEVLRINHSAVSALVALAENKSTPPDILEKIGHIQYLHSVVAVIENPNSPERFYRKVVLSKTPPADFYIIKDLIEISESSSCDWKKILERAELAHLGKQRKEAPEGAVLDTRQK